MNAFRAAATARLRCQFAVAHQALRLLLTAVEVLVPRFVVVVPVPVVAVPKASVVVAAAVPLLLVDVLGAQRAVPSLETPPRGPKCRGGDGDSFGRCAPCVAS